MDTTKPSYSGSMAACADECLFILNATVKIPRRGPSRKGNRAGGSNQHAVPRPPGPREIAPSGQMSRRTAGTTRILIAHRLPDATERPVRVLHDQPRRLAGTGARSAAPRAFSPAFSI